MRIILCEGVIPPGKEWHHLPLPAQRVLSIMDLLMLAFFNSKQRTVEDWTKLLVDVDSRLKLANVRQSPESRLTVLEIVFNG